MKKELELVKFNLTPDMSLELIKFNNLKKELNNIKNMYDLDKKDKKLQLQIQKLEEKIDISRNKFINEFRINNKEEIDKYLKMKEQN